MNRHLAHALGRPAGALLLQPVTRWPTRRTRAQRETLPRPRAMRAAAIDATTALDGRDEIAVG